MKRIIESKSSDSNEVLMVLIGSLHGNEKEGVAAITRTFNRLNENQISINGKIIGLAGNLQAIAEHKRFLSHDLNRCWTSDYVQKCLDSTEVLVDEDKELIELYHLLNEVIAQD